MQYENERMEIIRTVEKLYSQGLIHLGAGNVSLKVGDQHVLITRSGMPYEDMQPKDVVLVDLQGTPLEDHYKPSSEVRMHTIIYKEMPEVKAIAHTHSMHALAFATVGKTMPIICLEGLTANGIVPLAEYACPGTQKNGEVAIKALCTSPGVKAVLLRNHGLLSIGQTLTEARKVTEDVEYNAKLNILANSIGTPTPFTPEMIQEVHDVYHPKKRE
jgi:L-fuculose-phosphate aldolase